ncbi:MAG: tetratricopeptide repeat protein [bacterium]|nr:tetratricopeptide repeat protein [bacterium]
MRTNKPTTIAILTLALFAAACTQTNKRTVQSQNARNWLEADPTAMSTDKLVEEPQILPQTHFAAARLLEKQGQYEKAVIQYRKAIAVQHEYVAAYNALGIVLGRLGRHADAEDALRRAVELRPDAAQLRNNLGFEYALQTRWADAEAELSNAIRLKPDFARAWINLGLVLSKQQRFEEALDAFRTVLPEPDAFYNLGLMFRGQHRYRDAADAFNQVVALNPRFTAAKQQLEQLEPRLAMSTPLEPVAKMNEWPTVAGRNDEQDAQQVQVAQATEKTEEAATPPEPAQPDSLTETMVEDDEADQVQVAQITNQTEEVATPSEPVQPDAPMEAMVEDNEADQVQVAQVTDQTEEVATPFEPVQPDSLTETMVEDNEADQVQVAQATEATEEIAPHPVPVQPNPSTEPIVEDGVEDEDEVSVALTSSETTTTPDGDGGDDPEVNAELDGISLCPDAGVAYWNEPAVAELEPTTTNDLTLAMMPTTEAELPADETVPPMAMEPIEQPEVIAPDPVVITQDEQNRARVANEVLARLTAHFDEAVAALTASESSASSVVDLMVDYAPADPCWDLEAVEPNWMAHPEFELMHGRADGLDYSSPADDAGYDADPDGWADSASGNPRPKSWTNFHDPSADLISWMEMWSTAPELRLNESVTARQLCPGALLSNR